MQLVNLETENLFIGCLLKEGELIKDTTIQPKHLYDPGNQKILKIMRELETDNEKIDLVSVVVASKGQVDKKRLANLVNGVPSIEAFKMTEKHVFESYQLREAQRIQSIEIASLSDVEDIKEELSKLETSLNREEYDHKQAMIDLHDSIEHQSAGLSGYDTGFRDLNRYLDGFQEKDLIISAARPSLGKTAKMLAHVNAHCSKGKDHIAVVFSLEMSSEQLNKRMISQIGKIDGAKMRNPKQYFGGDDWNRFSTALGILSDMNIYIYDDSGQTPGDITQKVRKLRKDYPDGKILVMIDYLQLMRTDKNYESKNIEVGEISRSLKELARNESVPVYLLSQLSRGVESRQDKRPKMSDIRDSGSVEQDADVIEFLHRDDYYDAESEGGIMEVIIAKQRNGPVGTVELAYIKEHNGFYDLDYRYDN